MRVLVCGGRDYRNWPAVCEALQRLNTDTPIDLIIHGFASGADSLGCPVGAAVWRAAGSLSC